MFPKKSNKKEESYLYLKRIFATGGVDTEEQVLEHIDGLMKKSYRVTSIPVLILVLGGIFAPTLLFFWLLFSLMGSAWIWSSTYMTIKLMKRYIEELKNPKAPSSEESNDDIDTSA